MNDNSRTSGLGKLAPLNAAGPSQVTNLGNLAYANAVAANQIGAGILAAGVIYAGTIKVDKLHPGKLITVAVASKKGG